MLTVYTCIIVEHDLRLVALAAFICMFASFSALNLLIHAGQDTAWRRTLWVLGAGTVAGCGIWATHFIAMLAFRPGMQLSYDPGTTVLSFFVAIVFSTIGFALAARLKPAGIGGAVVGLAIGAMHYIGMSAVNAQSYIIWDRSFVAASIILGTIFAAAATQAAFSLKGVWRVHAAWMLLTLGICSLHFTGMAALNIAGDPTIKTSAGAFDSFILAIAVAAVSLLIVILAYAGIAMDRHLSQRAVQEAKRLRAYVTELEATKQRLETTSSELLVALKTASAADQAKSQFLATMSHELRTPLNAILGFSEIMKAETFGPLGNSHYKEYAGDIFRSGMHLLSLINDILDFTRADAGELQLSEEEVDVADAITDTLRMIEAQAAAQRISLSTNFDRTLPRLLADHRRLRQVLLNLLSNAVKFTPDGGSVTVEAFGGPAGLTIRVTDTGIGIAPEDIPVALERFGQIDSDLARKYEGTGLGLPLSKCLMEHHGGTLEIESEPGRGTRVSVKFPAERVIPRADRAARAFS
ncbi:MAG: MHYT domain-containing protein [Pseudomonadota bacterium]